MKKNMKERKPKEILNDIFEGRVDYPINLERIAKNQGLKIKLFNQKIKNESHEEIWGFLDKKSKIIGISNRITYVNSKRFTIAHELGHHFLDNDKKNDFFLRSKVGGYESKEERKYNDFAMNLLVLSDDNFERNKDIYSESELANLYGVPLSLIEHINYFKELNDE